MQALFKWKKVSPKGLAFVSCASGSTTSLAVRSVALWFVAPVGFVYSLLKAFCFRCCFSLASAVLLLQRKKVSPKGLTFVRCAAGLSTSLAARSVALWFGAPVGFVYSLLKAFCFRCCFSLASAVL